MCRRKGQNFSILVSKFEITVEGNVSETSNMIHFLLIGIPTIRIKMVS